MRSKRNNISRIDPEFEKIMRDVMLERAVKGLARNNMRELSLREATFLARTTPSFENVIRELKTLPKRKR